MEGITVRLHNVNMNWWLKLPATGEALQGALQEMGAEDGNFTIDRCRTDFGGKLDGLIVVGDLAAVNYLAARLAEITPAHFQKLEAVLDSPLRHAAAENIARVIDFTYNPDVYYLIPGVHNAEDLARHYIFDSGMVEMPSAWTAGINLPEFGKHLETCQPGFYVGGGYLTATGIEWQPVFEKSGVIPPEYRIGPEEQAAPHIPESYPAVYPHTEETARQNGELDLYAESLALNVRCALAIEESVRRKPDFDSPRLGHSAADSVLREYGAGRVLAVLAHTVRERDDDTFFSRWNRDWANSFPAPPPSERARFTVDIHPAVADSFITLARRAAQELERNGEDGHAAPVEVCIQNQEQPESGEWLALPADADALSGLFNRIGVSGPYDEGYILSDFHSPHEGVVGVLSRNDSLDELNMLASYLDGMEDWELAKLQATLKLDMAKEFDCAADLINLLDADNFDSFGLIAADNAEELGRYWDEEDPLGFPEGMTHEEYGRYAAAEEKGAFTELGYIYCGNRELSQEYDGIVPHEYRIVDKALLDARGHAPGKDANRRPDEKPSVMDQIKAARQAPHVPKEKDAQKAKKDKGGPEL